MINIKFIVLGNIKEAYLRDAIAEYSKRLGAFAKIEICELKEYKLPDNPSQSHIDAALEDEALNASNSPTLLSAYLKKRLGYLEKQSKGEQNESECGLMRLVFEHDIEEDGE